MQRISQFLISVSTLVLISASAAMAKCEFAPDNDQEVWKKDVIRQKHYIMQEGDKCFLNLKNSKPGFKVTGIYTDKDAKHGEIHEYFESPHDGGNALTYVPKPGFKGDETLMVTFETELNGQKYDTLHAKWRITVQ